MTLPDGNWILVVSTENLHPGKTGGYLRIWEFSLDVQIHYEQAQAYTSGDSSSSGSSSTQILVILISHTPGVGALSTKIQGLLVSNAIYLVHMQRFQPI